MTRCALLGAGASRTFSQREYAASELRLLLPAAVVDKLDFSSLMVESGSFVDEELVSTHSDLLFSLRLAGRRAFVYLLFEHQSTVAPLMVMRLLGYMVRIWARYLSDHPDATTLFGEVLARKVDHRCLTTSRHCFPPLTGPSVPPGRLRQQRSRAFTPCG